MGVAMPEAFIERWQEYVNSNSAGTGEPELKILVAVCNLLKMNLIASKPLLEGRVADMDIPEITNIEDKVCKHLQFVRSMPIRCHICKLISHPLMISVQQQWLA